jgi:hypothetical protein
VEREISLGELAARYPSELEILIKTEKARYLDGALDDVSARR